MTIEYHETIQKKLIPDIHELAYMIEESIHEPINTTFGKIYELLIRKKGIFFICYLKKEKISFGFLSNGGYDERHKRLMFFAVKKGYRNQSLGKNTLKQVIKDKINLDAGCTLACKSYLEKFYRELGFNLYKKVDNSKDEITMLLASINCNIQNNYFGYYHDLQIKQDYSIIYQKTNKQNIFLYRDIIFIILFSLITLWFILNNS